MALQVCVLMAALAAGSLASEGPWEYRVLATNRTSTMEKEMNEAAEAGYVFMNVMGGETGFGGSEVVVVMGRAAGGERKSTRKYKLLATSKTSTMQKELQEAGDLGFDFRGHTVFESTFGGREVCAIMERDSEQPNRRIRYQVLATSKTSTMQKELLKAGEEGYSLLGMAVGKTAFRGDEILCFLKKVVE